MLFFIISIVVPVLLFLIGPSVIEHILRRKAGPKTFLILACLAYFISWYIPSPLIEGKDTSFSTHFVGGGIFSGFVWLYIRGSLSWKPNWLQDVVGILAVVSMLGVANEIFEFVIVKIGLVHWLSSADTWWDLVANTSGALVFLLFTFLITVQKKSS